MAYKVTKIRKSCTNSNKKQVKSSNKILKKIAKISPIGPNSELSCEIEIGKWKLGGFVSEGILKSMSSFRAICNSWSNSGPRTSAEEGEQPRQQEQPRQHVRRSQRLRQQQQQQQQQLQLERQQVERQLQPLQQQLYRNLWQVLEMKQRLLEQRRQLNEPLQLVELRKVQEQLEWLRQHMEPCD
jgi:hypothetical protein